VILPVGADIGVMPSLQLAATIDLRPLLDVRLEDFAPSTALR
jgi:hypothetical protein